jgi:hypothetical protein
VNWYKSVKSELTDGVIGALSHPIHIGKVYFLTPHYKAALDGSQAGFEGIILVRAASAREAAISIFASARIVSTCHFTTN